MTHYVNRTAEPAAVESLIASGAEPLIARLLASRGVTEFRQVDGSLQGMLRPQDLKGASDAGRLLADAITAARRICIVADYDCDGASACALMLRGLALLGARPGSVQYLVPDRQRDGYGLTAAIVDRVASLHQPDVIVTVDNGIASFEGVTQAKKLGMQVLVTDHHLPALIDGRVSIPDATVTVNPSQPGCAFPSKAMCGAGVAFYVLLMARSALRERGVFDAATQPRLDGLLDLVALATVADVEAGGSNPLTPTRNPYEKPK